ncbi:MAG TPA: uracil-DNA glycosylase [Persephonella sp.]|uniref:Uracil-DNA glycosylase n=1 Tax=Persephonella marina (strain DSM 14350 / EX-H1) TaxID=123214 RepID=C0QTF7_PERMH|nr:conserved hypothetical protein [Persephonella marina EX-H1]HCB70409.1 uracil-DNA glycosylase [Persephonella sp.]
MAGKSVNCYRCKHFFITWDRNFPYGCRAYNFKSRSLPSFEVRSASGKECLSFEEKDKKV